MKKIALRFLVIGVALLIFGALTYFYILYKSINFTGPMINSYEEWLRRQEEWRASNAQNLIMLTIGELLIICGVAFLGVAAYITVKPSFKKP